ncbi:hypothetical protein M3Y97_01163100 [Aphelenchoides bicaudatus]|nr:hypothetical protein M3Y97_01163100 [Aphelenchoides bicaudatus]
MARKFITVAVFILLAVLAVLLFNSSCELNDKYENAQQDIFELKSQLGLCQHTDSISDNKPGEFDKGHEDVQKQIEQARDAKLAVENDLTEAIKTHENMQQEIASLKATVQSLEKKNDILKAEKENFTKFFRSMPGFRH